jgi:hypothetical protein
MRKFTSWLILTACFFGLVGLMASDNPEQSVPLGLPPISYPADNPQTPEKIALGDTPGSRETLIDYRQYGFGITWS